MLAEGDLVCYTVEEGEFRGKHHLEVLAINAIGVLLSHGHIVPLANVQRIDDSHTPMSHHGRVGDPL